MFRDNKTGKKYASKEEFEKTREAEREKKKAQRYTPGWGSGLAQQKAAQEAAEAMQLDAAMPFARTRCTAAMRCFLENCTRVQQNEVEVQSHAARCGHALCSYQVRFRTLLFLLRYCSRNTAFQSSKMRPEPVAWNGEAAEAMRRDAATPFACTKCAVAALPSLDTKLTGDCLSLQQHVDCTLKCWFSMLADVRMSAGAWALSYLTCRSGC